MEYKRNGNIIALRLDKNDEIIESLLKLQSVEKIKSGSITGIGGTDCFTIGIFNEKLKEYNKFSYTGTHEITSLVGNFSTINNSPYVHVHITAAGVDGVKAGHLLSCVISLTAEIFINISDIEIERKKDEELGINKWRL